MTMEELSRQYRDSSALLRQRIAELRADLTEGTLSETEKLAMRRRIAVLIDMARDASGLAGYLGNYYEEGQYGRDIVQADGIPDHPQISQTA